MEGADHPSITVVTISWRSASLISRLFRNLLNLADRPELLHLWIGDNTGGADPEISALSFPRLRIVPVDVGEARMSMAHALGLNALVSAVATPYLLVVDPDVALFARGWDTRLVEAVLRSGAACAGAPYPPWKLGKYHAFPSPIFAFWQVEALRKIEIDWRPYAHSASRRLGDFALRQTFWLPRWLDRYLLRAGQRRYPLGQNLERLVGTVSKDTGWWIAAQARERKMGAELFDVVVDPDRLGSGRSAAEPHPSLRAIAEEFELYLWQNEPFLTHRNPTWSQLDTSLWGVNNRPLLRNTADKEAMTRRWLGLVQDVEAQSIAGSADDLLKSLPSGDAVP